MKVSSLLKILILTIFLSSCNILKLENPNLNFYETIQFEIIQEQDIINEISQTKSNLLISLESLTPNLITSINSLHQKGKKIKVLTDNTSYTTGLVSSILKKSPQESPMKANMIIIDNTYALLLSSHNLTNNTLMIKVKGKNILNDLISEFNQMYELNKFGVNKVTYFNAKIYNIENNSVNLIFTPQEDFLKKIYEFIGQSYEEFLAYMITLDNNYIYGYLYELKSHHTKYKINLFSNFLTTYSNYIGILGDKTRIISKNYNINLMFSKDKVKESFLFTTFDFSKNLNNVNGIMIIVRGEKSKELREYVSAILENEPTTNISLGNIQISRIAPYTNIVISEINWAGAIHNDGTSYPYAEFIEIKNISTNYYDISGYYIIITNQNNPSSPSIIGIPNGTILAPGSFFVIGRKNYHPNAFTYYDILEDISLVNSGFSVSLVRYDGTTIDIAGNHLSSPLGGSSGNPRRTMVRKLESVIDGWLSSAWYEATNKLNINPNFTNNTFASPGGD